VKTRTKKSGYTRNRTALQPIGLVSRTTPILSHGLAVMLDLLATMWGVAMILAGGAARVNDLVLYGSMAFVMGLIGMILELEVWDVD